MRLFGFDVRRVGGGEARNVSPVNAEAWGRFFNGWNLDSTAVGNITVDKALTAAPVFAAVDFLSSALATLSVHVFRTADDRTERVKGGIATVLGDAINDEWSSYRWRKYSWWQTFTAGRQLTWIERPNGQILNLWPLDPAKTTIRRQDGRQYYDYRDGMRTLTYPAVDVIDVPFALEPDQVTHVSPINKGRNAIGLLLAMESYASKFFAGGGVPPLALEGPMPQGTEAFKRASEDIHRAVRLAKESERPFFPMPPGHKFTPVGFEPEKGQMTDARRFQVEEVARLYSLPPWFLQDLTRANFANSENQDLHLVKHTLTHWAKAWEQEANLKIFGRRSNARYVEHNMDSLLRGDFKSRADAVARLIQAGVYTPNDGRSYMGGLGASDDPNADQLYMQGATVPLGSQPVQPAPQEGGNQNDDGTPGADGAD